MLILKRVLFFVVVIAIGVLSDKAPSKEVWATFIHTGWENKGVSFCIGFLSPALALAGVCHLWSNLDSS